MNCESNWGWWPRVLWNSGHKIPIPSMIIKRHKHCSFAPSFFFFYFKSVYVLVCCSKVYIVLYRKRISFLDCVRMSVCFMFVYWEGWKIAGNMKLFFFFPFYDSTLDVWIFICFCYFCIKKKLNFIIFFLCRDNTNIFKN